MWHIQTEAENNNGNSLCYKPRQAHAGPCYFNSFVCATVIEMGIHDEIIRFSNGYHKFVNNSFIIFFFSIKHVCLMACNIYIVIQLFPWQILTTPWRNVKASLDKKEKVVCKDCFDRQNKNNLTFH